MPTLQRFDDVRAILGLLPDFLRLEVHQLWIDSRPYDLPQQAVQPPRDTGRHALRFLRAVQVSPR